MAFTLASYCNIQAQTVDTAAYSFAVSHVSSADAQDGSIIISSGSDCRFSLFGPKNYTDVSAGNFTSLPQGTYLLVINNQPTGWIGRKVITITCCGNKGP